jgi:hypothetical protein
MTDIDEIKARIAKRTAEAVASLHELSCGHSCIIAAPRGMATNGPCHHADFREMDRAEYRKVIQALRLYRGRVADLERELKELRGGA